MVGAGIGGEEQWGGVACVLVLDGGDGGSRHIRSGVYKGLHYHIKF